jgi:hypothetical protein
MTAVVSIATRITSSAVLFKTMMKKTVAQYAHESLCEKDTDSFKKPSNYLQKTPSKLAVKYHDISKQR